MNGIGIGLEGLGIDVENDAVSVEAPAEPQYKSTLVKGSSLARVLYQVMSGMPIVIVPAPPGGGKSTLVAELVNQLFMREDFTIVVAVPTKNAGAELAKRIHHELGGVFNDESGHMESRVKWAITSDTLKPAELTHTVRDTKISIRTVASCVSSPPACDVMIIDEAWQCINADVAPASDKADQIIMVGDSGQIGPVITIDVSQFKGDFAPHLQAPISYGKMENAAIVPVNVTYRLGAETVNAIAPLYDFEFASMRPDRALVHPTFGRMSEIESVEFGQVETPDDKVLLNDVLARAIGFIGAVVDEAGVKTTLKDTDVAIVVAHNSQSAPLMALAADKGLEGLLIGTADKLQGSQRHAVVSLDPLAGQSEAKDHHVSSGRACVMASRHMTHLTWMYPSNWRQLLEASELEDAPLGIVVRERLIAVSDNTED